jgi:DNA primase
MQGDTLEKRKSDVLDRLDLAGVINREFSRPIVSAGKNQVLVLCPVHAENNPSCSVNTDKGLWNCKSCGAKGNIFDLVAAARSCDFWGALEYLESCAGIAPPAPATKRSKERISADSSSPAPGPKKPRRQKSRGPKGKTVAVYRYFDAAGQYRYQKRRIEPGRHGKKKEFAFSHPRPDETEAPGRGDCPPLLYGLPCLTATQPGEKVFVVEGEGKVDALKAWGLAAVCTDSGAAGGWPDTFNELFKGRTVVIVPDNDGPGERYAANVAKALLPFAEAVKTLRLPGLPEKGDVLDWIENNLRKAADHG